MVDPIPSAPATVSVTFRGMLGSFGAALRLMVDEEMAGKVYPGERVELTVTPGPHQLRAEGGVRWSRSTSNTVEFEAGPQPVQFEVAFRDAYLPGTVGAVALFGRLSRQTQTIVLAIGVIGILILALRNRKIPALEAFSLRRVESPSMEQAVQAEVPMVSAYVDMMDAVDPRR